MDFNSNIVDNLNILENYQELKKTYKSDNRLYTYERTLVIGIRATQLSLGATEFIEVPQGIISVKEIAELELANKKIPFILQRTFDTHKEYWKLEDLV